MGRGWPLMLALTLVCGALATSTPAQQPQPFPRPADPAGRPAPEREPPARPADPERAPTDERERDRTMPDEPPLRSREVIVPDAPQPDEAPQPILQADAGDAGTAAALFPAEPTPSEATLGFPVMAGARFIKSFHAGQGQRYYLFGTTASFDAVVDFYREALRSRGRTIFEEPPVHRFEEGRFDRNRMAFPPGVSVSDFTWGNAEGYLDPQLDGEARRHQTVIQIVPPLQVP